MNKPAISSFKLSSYQSHPDNSNSNLNIPAVSHNYHRKISIIDTKKSSGSSELVHITSGVCMCAFLSTYTSSLCGLTMFHARERDESQLWIQCSPALQSVMGYYNHNSKKVGTLGKMFIKAECGFLQTNGVSKPFWSYPLYTHVFEMVKFAHPCL